MSRWWVRLVIKSKPHMEARAPAKLWPVMVMLLICKRKKQYGMSALQAGEM